MLQALFRFVVAERIGTIILSAVVAHTGWHWMIERWERLRQFGWPAINAALLVTAMRWLMVILIVAGLLWLIGVLRKRKAQTAESEIEPAASSDMANGPELVIESTAKRKSS